jgi:hypothetical protein
MYKYKASSISCMEEVEAPRLESVLGSPDFADLVLRLLPQKKTDFRNLHLFPSWDENMIGGARALMHVSNAI